MTNQPSGVRIGIFLVGTIALLVSYVTWRYGAGWHWLSIALASLLTAVSVVASVGNFARWDCQRRDDFNKGIAVAALALLLATTIGDAFDPAQRSIDYVSISLVLGIPLGALVLGLLLERRSSASIRRVPGTDESGSEVRHPKDRYRDDE